MKTEKRDPHGSEGLWQPVQAMSGQYRIRRGAGDVSSKTVRHVPAVFLVPACFSGSRIAAVCMGAT